jgi:predicted metal-dependent phosphoesterase TrpH
MIETDKDPPYALDLHCHTRERSGCSLVGEEALIRKAVRLGLAGIAFTDHHRLPPPGRLEELNRRHHPFRVFTGIEISILMAENWQDFLVIGLAEPALEQAEWNYAQLREFVREKGGWMAWAHPFRYNPVLPQIIKDDPPDALEMYSSNIRPALAPRIEALAREWGCQVIGASDAHLLGEVGYSAILMSQPAASEAELVALLKKGAFRIRAHTPGRLPGNQAAWRP